MIFWNDLTSLRNSVGGKSFCQSFKPKSFYLWCICFLLATVLLVWYFFSLSFQVKGFFFFPVERNIYLNVWHGWWVTYQKEEEELRKSFFEERSMNALDLLTRRVVFFIFFFLVALSARIFHNCTALSPCCWMALLDPVYFASLRPPLNENVFARDSLKYWRNAWHACLKGVTR